MSFSMLFYSKCSVMITRTIRNIFYIVESLSCPHKTITTLLIGYTPIWKSLKRFRITSSSPRWVQRLFPAGLPLLHPLDRGDHLCLLSVFFSYEPDGILPRWTRIQSEPKFAVALWILWVGPLDFHILPFLTAKFLPLTILSQLRSHQSPSLPSMNYWYVLRWCFFLCVYSLGWIIFVYSHYI